MNAKDWLTQVASFVERECPLLKAPRRHFSSFVGSLGHEKHLHQYLMPKTVEEVGAEIKMTGVLPSYPEIMSFIRKSADRIDANKPKKVAGGVDQPEEERQREQGLRYFSSRIEEVPEGQARDILVSFIRTYYQAAYKVIAEEYDHERWADERRRAAEFLDRRRIASMEQAARLEREGKKFIPPQARGLAQQHALPGPVYKKSGAPPPETRRFTPATPSPGQVAAMRRGARPGDVVLP